MLILSTNILDLLENSFKPGYRLSFSHVDHTSPLSLVLCDFLRCPFLLRFREVFMWLDLNDPHGCQGNLCSLSLISGKCMEMPHPTCNSRVCYLTQPCSLNLMWLTFHTSHPRVENKENLLENNNNLYVLLENDYLSWLLKMLEGQMNIILDE